MTLAALRAPFSLDPTRGGWQRRALLVTGMLVAIAAGSVGLVRLFAAPGPPMAGRAGVVRIVALPRPQGPSIIAAPTLGNVHVSGAYLPLRSVERLIPRSLPKNPVQACRTGPTVTFWLRDGRVFTYGPCKRPASIERLRLALTRRVGR